MRRCIELGCGLTQFGIRSGTQEEFEFKRKILGEFVPKYVPRIDGNSEFPSENQPGQTVHENQFTSKNQSENGFSGKNQIVQTVHENQFTDEIQSVNQLSANKIPKNAPCYLSIDLDVLDPSIFCGTGTPEPGGWLWNEFIAHVYDVLSNYNIVGADIVELAPNYDPSGVSTVVACKVLREILLALSQN
jgi:arginase family enzyme